MGGSGLPGYALDSYALVEKLPIKVSVWNAYDLPPIADRAAPVFCVSYSGNTEETVSNFLAARRRGYPVIAVTTGGKLAALAQRAGAPILRVPSGIPPRSALGHMTGAIARALRARKILPVPFRAMRTFWAFNPKKITPESRRLARGLAKRIPLVYTSREWYAVGHIWKIAFNETAKIPAFSYTIPEANHNEMEGFAGKPFSANRNFHALFVVAPNDHPRVKRRMDLSRRTWLRAGVPGTAIELGRGEFWPVFFRGVELGYAAAAEIARMRRVDPDTTAIIETFKKQMARP
jgi:glucose/mannose-6-phosphate isomerase